MDFEAIALAILGRIEDAVGLLPYKPPNVSLGSTDLDHLRVDIMFNRREPVGLLQTNITPGIIQVAVYSKRGSGTIQALAEGDKVLELFPRNLELGSLRIDRPGWISAGFEKDGWWITPISIPFRVIN